MKILGYLWALPAILLFAWLDTIIINKGNFLGYVIVVAFEYGIFWLGIYVGINAPKDKVQFK